MDTINGLPLHPLVVHFVVVAVPVTALVAIAVAVWPLARTKLGYLPSILALLSLIAVPIASTAGESLKEGLPPMDAVQDHAEWGDVVIIGVGCMFGAVLLLQLLAVAAVVQKLSLSAGALKAVDLVAKILVVAAAIASLYLVFMAGDTGTRAVWGQ